jgi:hypothetical protein
MTVINLVPPDTVARLERGRKVRRWSYRLAICCFLAFAVYLGLGMLTASQSAELQKLTGKYTELQGRLQFADSLLIERDQLERNQKAIALVRGHRTAAWLLEILGETLTPDSYLSLLKLDQCPYVDPEERNNRKEGSCTPALDIRGFAPGHKEVGQIIRRLVSSGQFMEVSLISVKDPVRSAKTPLVEFEIHCALTHEDQHD